MQFVFFLTDCVEQSIKGEGRDREDAVVMGALLSEIINLGRSINLRKYIILKKEVHSELYSDIQRFGYLRDFHELFTHSRKLYNYM